MKKKLMLVICLLTLSMVVSACGKEDEFLSDEDMLAMEQSASDDSVADTKSEAADSAGNKTVTKDDTDSDRLVSAEDVMERLKKKSEEREKQKAQEAPQQEEPAENPELSGKSGKKSENTKPAQTSTPKAETPAPQPEVPAPQPEAPAPQPEAPAPQPEAPALQPEAPAQQEQAAPEKTEQKQEKKTSTPAQTQSRDDWSFEGSKDFSIHTMSGSKFKLSNQVGKVVIVNFWATWCGPCTREMSAFEKLYSDYGGSGEVEVLCVNVGDDSATTEYFIENNGYHFPVAVDEDNKLSGKFSIRAIPRTIVFGKNGAIYADYTGAGSADAMYTKYKNAIEGALAE